jgi:hypothetical protein
MPRCIASRLEKISAPGRDSLRAPSDHRSRAGVEGAVLPLAVVRAWRSPTPLACPRRPWRDRCLPRRGSSKKPTCAPPGSDRDPAQRKEIQRFIEGADDERWLKVIGVMNRAEDPAAAAVAAMLAEPVPAHTHKHAPHRHLTMVRIGDPHRFRPRGAGRIR